MLDIAFIRGNTEKVKKGVAAKQLDPVVVDRFLQAYLKFRDKDSEYQELNRKVNLNAKRQGEILSQGLEEAVSSEERKKLHAEATELKKKRKKIWEEIVELKKVKDDLHLKIPNLPADDVKEGKDESDNEILRSEGEPKKFDFKAKDHLELGEALGIIDVTRAAKVSGTRFGYLKGGAALLEFALVQFAMETLIKEGFVPVVPPVFIKKEMMGGMGYLEHGGEEDMYVFDKDGLVLTGTSEQSIGPMHANEILDGKKLPLRYASFSTCFRRESGSYGKDTKGIIRVHQFDKVEMFSFTKPQDSDKEHEFLLSLEEKLFKTLKIPYRVVKMCSGDLGPPATRKYDLEAYLPGQDTYKEVTSTSNCTDFQARRLNIKYQDGGKTGYVHTLNGTAFAIGRTIVAILENYQQKDGTFTVPEVLRKWMAK